MPATEVNFVALNSLLVCRDDEAGGYAVALFYEYKAFANEFVYYLFGIVTDSDEFDVGVVEHFVFVFEFVDHALEVDFVVVNAEREADSGSLHKA